MWPMYHLKGHVVANSTSPQDYDILSQPVRNLVVIDIATSFTVLVGIFFPSVTGSFEIIMIYIFQVHREICFCLLNLKKQPC